ncbi:unnamed protein product [Paramecium octaurelia]|uniref:NAD(P)(+)--arginine ADP-ribosyltransferase n=1 Tax=Paramecium octaurelia TaxID=43137 RepID=A0A8S1YI93_PAROT|nr:unnamed protein product [Paramecium octaurelia]
MYQFQVPIEDIMDLPPIVEEIYLGLSIKIFIELDKVKEMITIDINSETKIQELKEIILKKYLKQLINIDSFDLYYGDQKMDKSKLIYYQIENNAVIEVVKAGQFEGEYINIVVECGQFNKIYYIEIKKKSRIGELAEEFRYMRKLRKQERIYFLYNNYVIEHKETFDYYHIKNNATLTMKFEAMGGCFPGYAPITLADKSQRPINQIKKGDHILCYDYELRNFRSGIVQGTTKTKQTIQVIRIETEIRVIECTADHPFYTETGWKAFQPHPDFQINNLTLEDKLLNQDNTFIKILSIQKLNKFDYVYNLNLQYPNNYLAFGFLAHNMNIINIVIDEQNQEEFEYFPGMLIQSIKVLIFKRRGIPIENQKLYFHDQLMDDEKALSDYLGPDEKICELKLQVFLDKEQQQQQNNIIKPNSQVVSVDIITNTSRYQLLLRNGITLNELKKVLYYFENKKYIMIDGKQYTSEFDEKNINEFPKIQQILLLSKEEGGLSISFYQEINTIELSNVSELKQSLQSLNSDINFDQYLETKLLQINQNQQKAGIYQKYKLHHLLALMLWTSNRLYKQLNEDLMNNSYRKWIKYLKCLFDGLKSSEYYGGKGFRGIKNYQNIQHYEIKKIVQWRNIQAISLRQEVAMNFSNSQGMIFEIEILSSKIISQVSEYPTEQEVIMFPFSTYEVLNVTCRNNQPVVVQMREISLPRNQKNILWVDDNPENNYKFATNLERQDGQLSIIFCKSTSDAILIINSYKWLLYLQTTQFRIVSDMVRIENHKTNYIAGVELLKRLHQEVNYNGEILFFVFDVQQTVKSLQQTNYLNYQVTKHLNVLEKFIRFE